MSTLILPVASRAVLESCRRLGMEPDGILAGAGLARSRLEDPDARLPAAAADALWREAYARAGDPFLALHAAEATPFGAFRVLDYLGTTGPTLGDGFRRIAGYFPLIDPRGLLRVEEASDPVTLVFQHAEGGVLPAPAQEYTLALLLLHARHAAAREWRPTGITFAFPRPGDTGEYARVLGVAPRFDAEVASLAVPRSAWELPTCSGDPGLFAILDEHARALLERAPVADDFAGRVRAAIAADLPGSEPSLAAVARRLAMSRRSLQRRLEAGGTTFARLVDQVRRERAEAFLHDANVSVAEVSWLVGFSEQSAFTRAFRRWTGQSPTEYRSARAGGGIR